MANVGFASLAITPSFNGFQSKLERGTFGALGSAGARGGVRFGDAAGRSAGSRFGRVFSTAAKASLLGVAGGVALAAKFGADAVGAASDQQESINAVNVAYGKQARAVQKLGRQSAKALALPRKDFNELAVRFSNFASTVAGGDGKKTVKTLDDLTTRAADFASVFNTEVSDAATLFQSGLAGETEPLRRFGIDMSAAAVEAFAFKSGLIESKDELTEGVKVQARYGILMRETAKTQGDLANTSDSLANRQRFLNARWDDAKAKLGKGLLPIVEDFTGFLLDDGIPAVEDFSDWFNRKGIPAIKDLGKKLRPLAAELLPAAASGFKAIRNFAEDALPFAEGIVGAFNDMPGWVKKVLIGGTAGGLAAKKLGLGKFLSGGGGPGGFLSRGGSPARPLYVFTVNGGGGVPGVPKGGNLPKFAPLIPIGIGGAPGQASLLDKLAGGSDDFDNIKTFDPKEVAKNTAAFEALGGKIKGLGGDWDKARAHAGDYFTLIQQNRDTTLQARILGWDQNKQAVRDYLALLAQVRAAHVAAGFNADGTAPAGPGGRPNLTPSRGVQVNIGTVQAHDYKDFTTQIQRRSISGASDGWGR